MRAVDKIAFLCYIIQSTMTPCGRDYHVKMGVSMARIPFAEGDAVTMLPGYADALAKKDVIALTDMLVAAASEDDGSIKLGEWDKICFAVAINSVGKALSGRNYGELIQVVARYIKPFECVRTGRIDAVDTQPLKVAIRQFFMEITP